MATRKTKRRAPNNASPREASQPGEQKTTEPGGGLASASESRCYVGSCRYNRRRIYLRSNHQRLISHSKN